MHEGDVVMVEGQIMHEPKVSALSARDHYYIAREVVNYTKSYIIKQNTTLSVLICIKLSQHPANAKASTVLLQSMSPQNSLIFSLKLILYLLI